MEKHLLLTRYDPVRAERGDMLKVDDVLEILSIPLLGIIPESMDVLRASNLGSPVTLATDLRCGGFDAQEHPETSERDCQTSWPGKSLTFFAKRG